MYLHLLKQTVRPEFLNRIDDTIMFTPLSKENIVEIVGLQLKSVTKMVANKVSHLMLHKKLFNI